MRRLLYLPIPLALTVLMLLASLAAFVDHDHEIVEVAGSCVSAHSAGPEEGHTDDPHLRSADAHEHECQACQQQRLRSALLPTPAGVDALAASVPDRWTQTSRSRSSAAWSYLVRGPPERLRS